MKYTGEFLSIHNNEYKVTLETKQSGSAKTLRLGGTPFVVTYSPDDDAHMYVPIKSSGATIQITMKEPEFNFYTGDPLGVKVTFSEVVNGTENIKWLGYVAPTMYAQGFDRYIEEMDIDCVDGIAVLKDIPYKNEGANAVDTLGNILSRCIQKAGLYRYLYITDNVQLTSPTATENVLEKLRISQLNFFDEKKDINQTDDDVAWSCYDVIYEICQFMGYTLFAQGQDIYIVDYDAITMSNNKYFRYNLSGLTLGTSTGSVSQPYYLQITGDNIAEGGSQIELDQVYNKVSVKDEFNTFDSLFPNFGDIHFENNITATSDSAWLNLMNDRNANLNKYAYSTATGQFIFGDIIQKTDRNGKNDSYYVFVHCVYKSDMRVSVVKFYDSHVFTFKKYQMSRALRFPDVTNNSTFNTGKISDMLGYNGAFYYRWYGRDISQSEYEDWKKNHVGGASYWSKTPAEKEAIWKKLLASNSAISYTPMVVFQNAAVGTGYNASTTHIGPGNGVNGQLNGTDCNMKKPYSEEILRYPYMVLKADIDAAIFGGNNARLRITGKCLYHDESRCPWPMNGGANNGKLKREEDLKDTDQGFIWAKLKFGNLYWDQNDWTTTETWFKLYYWSPKTIDREGRKNKNIYDREFTLIDYDSSAKNAKCDILIPAPQDGNLQGKVELMVTTRDMHGDSRRSHWHADSNWGDNRYCRYLTGVFVLKDFNIKAEIDDDMASADANSDTVYTNIIENGAVQKMDEITFKVCTNDNKKPNYSSVDYLDGTKSVYLTTTYNKALYQNERGSQGFDKQDGRLRQEEHLIFKLASQYEEPRAMWEGNLKGVDHKLYGTYADMALYDVKPNGRGFKTFIPLEMEIDYKLQKTHVKLLERWNWD